MMISEEKLTPESGREKHKMRGNIYSMRDLHGRMANLGFSSAHCPQASATPTEPQAQLTSSSYSVLRQRRTEHVT